MADIIKKATRESYGEALAELGDKYENLFVLDADLQLQQKPEFSKRSFLTDFLTAVLQRQI